MELTDLPAEGRDFSFEDQDSWAAYFRTFRMPARIGRPLAADFRVQPADRGVLVTGRLSGSVVLECDRCTGEVEHQVDLALDLYAEVPAGGDDDEKCDFLKREDGRLYLNPAEMLWEEFSLNLPNKLVCARDCKGLCPECGVNLNTGDCACEPDLGDPRLAALRGLKIGPK
jgi:uncharacterized protein